MAPISLGRYLPRLRRFLVLDEAEVSNHWLFKELGGPMIYFAPVVWVMTFLLPTRGLGISFCVLNHLTHRCCPGCGLTRSFISISHLDFALAWHYHPFGFAGYAIMVLLTVFCFLPRTMRTRTLHWFDARKNTIMPSLFAGAAAFCLYGLWRFLAGVVL